MNRYLIHKDHVQSNGQAIPIVWRGDLLVAGGGPGGLGAAFTAHRAGLSVMLVEQLGFLGGMASYGCGMPLGGAYPAYTPNGGFAEEIIDMVRTAGKDAADVRVMGQFSYWFFHDSEVFKSLIAEKVLAEKLPVQLHTMVTDIIMIDDETVGGVIIESKSGRQAMLAKAFIDATGDADLCARAGAAFRKGRDKDGAMMATTIVFSIANVDTDAFFAYKETDPAFEAAIAKAEPNGEAPHPDDKLVNICSVLRKGSLFCNTVRVKDIDGTDAADLTRAELEARVRILRQLNFLRKYVPGCEKAYIGSTGATLGVRESRRIVGEETLTDDDVMNNTKRETGICRCQGPFDNASRGKDDKHASLNVIDEKEWYHIPYGALVPKGLRNLAVAGRTFSCDCMALTASRGIALMMCLGQAAGDAAAMAVKEGIAFRDIDVPALQNTLRAQGCNLDT